MLIASKKSFFETLQESFPKPVVFIPSTLALGFAGPFGTFEQLTLTERLIFWSVAMVGCGLFFNTCILLALRLKALASAPRTLRIVLGCASAALPGAILLALLDSYYRGSTITPDFISWLWLCVGLVGTPIGLIQYLWPQTRLATQQGPIYSVPFFSRIPDNLGTDLISLTMQDHYVEVTTTKGKTMVLMRFTDALEELNDYPGLQVHRSHWVAERAISSLARVGRNSLVELSDGRRLPISRNKQAVISQKLNR